MKKIGIISDTHGLWDDRYAKHFMGCDEIWHAGDIGNEDVIDRLAQVAPVIHAVYGNVDGGMLRKRFHEVDCFTTEGVKVWMTHIGGYPGRYAMGVKAQLMREQPKLFISGHSHILKVVNDRQLGLLHINPGAAGRQGWQTVRTLVLLTLDAGDIKDCEVVEMRDKMEPYIR
ncbi:MAG: metallophosphatase family protein [Muribaculaceae bacterium]|jgi:putative phosphoesterase|nr:metallophosphatase family protein [Muribaculaceae bacterium]